ncbi:MAG: cytochrome c [Crocinitomicaceae bacterium]|nr:cytochrome c [Crocinitomicaceae bacterium]
MKIKTIHVFLLLSVLYLLYSLNIYLKPLQVKEVTTVNKFDMTEGRLVWQKYNCQACHQLYHLGGYLGPDLTNVYSKYNGNADVIKGFVKAGIRQMPSFNLSTEEERLLIEFLKETDASGSSDMRNYKVLPNGMIEQDGKK